MAESDLANQIMSALQEYDENVAKKIDNAAEKTSSGMRKHLGTNSPKLTGSYRKSWATRSDKDFTIGAKVFTVHNTKKHQLTHLLEKPHDAPYGHGTVAGRPHIAPAEKQYTEEFIKLCEEACKG